MSDDHSDESWRTLLRPATLPALGVLLAGILLHSMNVLLLATIMPSIVADIRGEAMIVWPTTAYLASSIVATTVSGRLTSAVGAARTFCWAAFAFALGGVVAASAPSMAQVIGGRFLQGLGGGLLSALTYVLARQTFPAALMPRVLALLASVWSVSALIGPLIGGAFATYLSWRGSFIAMAALAAVVGLVAYRVLPANLGTGTNAPSMPLGLIALVSGAIAVMSLSAVVTDLTLKSLLVVVSIAAMALMVRLNARSSSPLLPTDAFTLNSATGLGLWMTLLLSIAFSPINLYVPVLLQKLHGFSPIAAGYTVAGSALTWTLSALVTASWSRANIDRLLVVAPLVIAAGLAALAVSLPGGQAIASVAAVLLVGAGMGGTWSFVAQRVMERPRDGEGNVAASSVATIQQTAFGLGSALAGIVANLAGFTIDSGRGGLLSTTAAVPLAFAAIALVAALVGRRLATVARSSSAPLAAGERTA